MSDPRDPPPDHDQRHATGFRGAALSGGGWASAQAIGGKLISLGTAVVLAWLLTVEEFGVYGVASTIGIFLLPFTPVVMGDILLNLRDQAARLYPAAERLLLISCGASTLLLALLAFPIEHFAGEEGLALTVAVVALRPLLGVPGTLALSRLRFQLRYRDIAAGAIATTLASAIGSIVLALLGAGPLALAVPLVTTQLVGAAIYRSRSADPKDMPHEQAGPEEVRTLRRSYLMANLGQYVHVAVTSVDLLILGAVVSTAVVGQYYFAQNLAMQSNMLIAYAIGMALQPIFAHLAHDPPRQLEAFRRAARAMAVMAAPLCLIQAALALPILRAAFSDQWSGAAVPLIALSIAQAFMFLVGPLTALLRAQGRFRAFLVWQLIFGATTIAAVLVCIAVSDTDVVISRVAWCVAASQSVSTIIGLAIAFRGSSHGVRAIFSILIAPNLCGSLAAGSAWLVAHLTQPWWDDSRLAAAIVVATSATGAVGMHAVLVRMFLPDTWRELRDAVVHRLQRGR